MNHCRGRLLGCHRGAGRLPGDSQKSYYRFETTVPNGLRRSSGWTGFRSKRQDRRCRRRDYGHESTTTTYGTDAIAHSLGRSRCVGVDLRDEPITYIVSIVPGTVLAVKAYKQLTGERKLVDVPADLYTVPPRPMGP